MCPLSGVERFPLFGGFQCTNFNGRAIGTGNNVRYIEVVRSWDGRSVNRGSTVLTSMFSLHALTFYQIIKYCSLQGKAYQ